MFSSFIVSLTFHICILCSHAVLQQCQQQREWLGKEEKCWEKVSDTRYTSNCCDLTFFLSSSDPASFWFIDLAVLEPWLFMVLEIVILIIMNIILVHRLNWIYYIIYLSCKIMYQHSVLYLKVRLEGNPPSQQGRILFCTTGILLRRMQNNTLLKGTQHTLFCEA